MRIALDPRYRDEALRRFAGHDLVVYRRDGEGFEGIVNQVAESEVLVLGRTFGYFGRETIEALPHLRFVQKSGSGVDALDVDSLTERGVMLANNAGVNAPSVAEHAIGLALMCLHDSRRHIDSLLHGEWKSEASGADIVRLAGRTVGILGFGHIGAHIARRVSAFEARVIAHQRHAFAAATVLGGVEWVQLEALLRRSDVLFICVPLTAETRRMIGPAQLALMKPSAVLVNCSRGGVVDEQALAEALRSGGLSAAATDVFEQEPPPPGHPLLALPNLVATPHIGGRSSDMAPLQIDAALTNVARYLEGRLPERLVNPRAVRDRGPARSTTENPSRPAFSRPGG